MYFYDDRDTIFLLHHFCRIVLFVLLQNGHTRLIYEGKSVSCYVMKISLQIGNQH